jgi:hypothetical protein
MEVVASRTRQDRRRDFMLGVAVHAWVAVCASPAHWAMQPSMALIADQLDVNEGSPPVTSDSPDDEPDNFA